MRRLIIGVMLVLAACSQPDAITTLIVRNSAASVAAVPYEQMVAQADAIVLGRVSDISERQWNHDTPDTPYMCEGDDTDCTVIEFFEVQVTVNEVLASTEAAPVNEGEALLVTMYIGLDRLPALGDEMVLFVEERRIAWRNSEPKPILTVMGGLEQGAYTHTEEGYRGGLENTTRTLTEFTADINRLR